MTELSIIYPDSADGEGLYYFDAATSPVRISGLPWRATNGNWDRLDNRRNDEYNDGLVMLSHNTSGVQISFKTTSEKLGVRVTGVFYHRGMPHMTANANMGVDVYIGEGRNRKFLSVIHAEPNENDRYGREIPLSGKEEKEITLYLPLYSGIKSFEIGLDRDSLIGDPSPYDFEKPVLFYGSSITQGACASRPGLSYCNILSRKFNFEEIDLGFSGCARGETVIAELIASLDLAAFVYDYDHNAESAEYLEKTHAPFFEIIRNAHPELPVIMVSKADLLYGAEETRLRRDVIEKTYKDAVACGDKKVWFVDGTKIYGDDADNCTVDGVHPNDLGFRHMVESIYPALAEALNDR